MFQMYLYWYLYLPWPALVHTCILWHAVASARMLVAEVVRSLGSKRCVFAGVEQMRLR